MHRDRSLSRLVLALMLAMPIAEIGAMAVQPPATQNAVAQTVAERKAEGDRFLKQGNDQLNAGQADAALKSLEPALAIYREIHDRAGEGQTLKSLGNVFLILQQYDKALPSFQKSLAIAREIKNQDLEARSLNNLGRVYGGLKRPDEAIVAYQQSLAVSRSSQNWAIFEIATTNLGDLYKKSHKYSEAITVFQDSLAISRELKNSDLEVKVLINIGRAYQESKNLVKAIEYSQQALTGARSLQNHLFEMQALGLLTQLYTTLGPAARVIEYGEPGLKLARQLKRLDAEAIFSVQLSAAYSGTGRTQEAIAAAQRTVALRDKFDSEYKSTALLVVAVVYMTDNRDQEAIDALQLILTSTKVEGRQLSQAEARKQAETIVNSLREAIKPGQAKIEVIANPSTPIQTETDKLLQVAYDHLKLGESRKAIAATLKILKDNGTTKNLNLEGQAYNLLARAYAELGQHQDAIKFARKAIEIAHASNNSELEGFSLVWQSIALSDSDDQGALSLAQQAIKKSREIKNRKIEAWANYALSITTEDQQAVEFAQEALNISREIKDREVEAWANLSLATAYIQTEASENAGKAAQESLEISQAIKNRMLEGRAHALSGIAASMGENPQTALDSLPKALAIANELENESITLYALLGLTLSYAKKGEHQKVIENGEQLLEIAQQQKNLDLESTGLTLLINSYIELKNYPKSIELSKRLIAIAHTREETDDEIAGLSLLALSYTRNGQTKLANQSLLDAEIISRKLSVPEERVDSLARIKNIYEITGNSRKVDKLSQEMLNIARQEGNPDLLWTVLESLGESQFYKSGNLKEMAGWYDEYLTLARKTKQYDVDNISTLMVFFFVVEDYKRMEETGKEYLGYARESEDRNQELGALFGLSVTYWLTQDKVKSQQIIDTDLEKFSDSKNHQEKAVTTIIRFVLFNTMEEYQRAVISSEEFIALIPQLEDAHTKTPAFLISILTDGIRLLSAPAYAKANRPQEAILILQNGVSKLDEWAPLFVALSKGQENPFNSLKAVLFTYMAEVYRQEGLSDKAIDLYQKALSLPITPGNGNSNFMNAQTISYVGLAKIYRQRNFPIAATTYYKEAVGQLDQQRKNATADFLRSISGQLTDLAKLNLENFSQSSFLRGFLGDIDGHKNSDIYRELADLLLSQGRILEAQQVLEILKNQELKDFDSAVRAKVDKNGKTIEIKLDKTEKAIIESHTTYIAFAQKIKECEDRNEPCEDLRRQRKQAKDEYEKVVQSFEQALKARKANDEKNFLDPKNPLAVKAQEIIRAQPNTALIYTLVTDKRLWIVLATQSEVLRSFEVDISQQQLSDKVREFQSLVKQCEQKTCTAADTAAFKAVSQQLYTWLFPKDLQTELQGTKDVPKIEHLVFALDRVTRYIPMSALFDGQKYLIQDYTVATIVSAESTRSERLPAEAKNTKVLALGLSAAKPPEFPYPLSAVEGELNAILRDESDDRDQTGDFPGRKFLNQQFTTDILEQYLPNRQILHIATHGEFVGGTQEQSYILLGNGNKLKISEMLDLYGLPGVNLVVLSACQTALASQTADGVEISSVGNAFFEKGVKSVVASLWNVSDTSTSLLMQEFYKHLAEGKTKSAALRAAQLDLMTGKKTEKDAPRGGNAGIIVEAKPGRQITGTRSPDFTHPYYWAPFILIGNGL
jgi:CHAT domain-containing protein/uncharacterized protein YqfB (UPF0267 family)